MGDCDLNNKAKTGDANDVDKILNIVIKKRKTFPAKCMELFKRMTDLELIQLEKSTVISNKSPTKNNFKKKMQGVTRMKCPQFTLEDLITAENKLKKCYEQAKEINLYLQNTEKQQSSEL